MPEETFEVLDRLLHSGEQAEALDFLIAHFRESKDFHLFFEAKLMKERLQLGLPLIQTESSSEFPPDVRTRYNDAMAAAARETGTLALEAGAIGRAWMYFRAIGEPGPIVDAIDRVQPGNTDEQVIQIAFQEGLHPVKGLQLILHEHGMCRALTVFGMYTVEKGREECIALLVRALHAEVIERMSRAIEAQEGQAPQGNTVVELAAGRDWLFGEYDTYVDTSHLMSLLPYSTELTDREVLALFHDLCEYGKRLSPMFHMRSDPPFEKPYVDYDEYVQALLSVDVDERIAYFRKKIAESDPQEVGSAPAQLLVKLLVRLGRLEEALQVSVEHLVAEDPRELACPSILQLCNMSGDYERMKEFARSRGDLLSYVAAVSNSPA